MLRVKNMVGVVAGFTTFVGAENAIL